MDDASAFLATDGDDNTPQDSRNLAAEWGPSDFDVRHRLVLTTTWEVPAKSGSICSRPSRATGRSARFSARSRAARSRRASASTTATPATSAAARSPTIGPNVVTGARASGRRAVSYGGQTFAIAPPFTFGNAGRNSLTGPAYAALDAGSSRRLPLRPMRTLELRLEIFNALNRKNYQIPDSFVDRATFGQSLSAFPPRQLQLAARFTF